MAETYGTTTIPGDQIQVRSGGTVSISAAFDTTVGFVGGMDTANGNATPGNVVNIESSADAATQFGENSELKKQVDLAYANGTGSVVAVGVTETTTTKSFTGTQSGTLGNVPVFDPNVHPEHSITADDTTNNETVDVTVTYETGADISTPSGPNEMNLNPITGEWEADESVDYDINYTYGDYSSAITELAKEVPRFLVVLTENTSVANDVLTEVNNYDTDFDFMRGMVGAMPEVGASSYSDSFDDKRLSVVAPSRAYIDDAETEMVRVLGATGGLQSGKALGDSTTYEGLSGLTALNSTYTNSELGTLIDEQVYPLRQSGGIQVIKDMTTSTDAKFERIYAGEIVDEATEISHQIAQQFIGDANTQDNRFLIRESHDTSYSSMQSDQLLDGYAVGVDEGANDNEVVVTIGLDVIDVIDTIDVTITVGDVISNQGAT